jgi:hypothetical protein
MLCGPGIWTPWCIPSFQLGDENRFVEGMCYFRKKHKLRGDSQHCSENSQPTLHPTNRERNVALTRSDKLNRNPERGVQILLQDEVREMPPSLRKSRDLAQMWKKGQSLRKGVRTTFLGTFPERRG